MTLDTIIDTIKKLADRGYGEVEIKNYLMTEYGMPEQVWEKVKEVALKAGIDIKRAKLMTKFSVEKDLGIYRRMYYKKHRDKWLAYWKTHKDVLSAIKKRYRMNHKDELKERRRRYIEANREKIRKKRREYYQKNKERLREAERERYLRNRERIRENQRHYYLRHRDEILRKRREKRTKSNRNNDGLVEVCVVG